MGSFVARFSSAYVSEANVSRETEHDQASRRGIWELVRCDFLEHEPPSRASDRSWAFLRFQFLGALGSLHRDQASAGNEQPCSGVLELADVPQRARRYRGQAVGDVWPLTEGVNPIVDHRDQR